MKFEFGRPHIVALLVFVLSLIVCPVPSIAQDDVFTKDTNIGGGIDGNCNYCTQDYCGCDPGTFSIGVRLTSWDCTCSLHICEQHCNYS